MKRMNRSTDTLTSIVMSASKQKRERRRRRYATPLKTEYSYMGFFTVRTFRAVHLYQKIIFSAPSPLSCILAAEGREHRCTWKKAAKQRIEAPNCSFCCCLCVSTAVTVFDIRFHSKSAVFPSGRKKKAVLRSHRFLRGLSFQNPQSIRAKAVSCPFEKTTHIPAAPG